MACKTNLRPVKFNRYIPNKRSLNSEGHREKGFRSDGKFHQWVVVNTDKVVALIEECDGTMVTVPMDDIKFADSDIDMLNIKIEKLETQRKKEQVKQDKTKIPKQSCLGCIWQSKLFTEDPCCNCYVDSDGKPKYFSPKTS